MPPTSRNKLTEAARAARLSASGLANGAAFYAAQIAGQDSAVETALAHLRGQLSLQGQKAA